MNVRRDLKGISVIKVAIMLQLFIILTITVKLNALWRTLYGHFSGGLHVHANRDFKENSMTKVSLNVFFFIFFFIFLLLG